MSRRRTRLLLLAWVLAAGTVGGVSLTAQSVTTPPPQAPAVAAVEEIDRVADRWADLVVRQVPDTAGTTLWLLPFVTDSGTATRFGHRLQSAIHLRLLRRYQHTRVYAVTALPARGAAAVTEDAQLAATSRDALAIEIQPFHETVRVVLRLLRSGRLRAGDWVDLTASTEISELLDGADDLAAVAAFPRTPAPEQLVDPFEPDDVPGFEVTVELDGDTELDRALTRGDRDRFAFLVDPAAPVTVETITEIDTQLLLYREGDRIPFSVNDDRAGGGGSRLALDLAAGWYVAEVVGFTDEVTGRYRITIGTTEPDLMQSDGAPRAPLATAIALDEVQERYTSGGEDWVELQVPVPGFYRLHAHASDGPLELTLHFDRAQPALVSAAPDRTLALFAGPGTAYARVSSTAHTDLDYRLTFTSFTPPRRFADGAPFTLSLDRGAAFHTLRIFRGGVYAVAIRGASGEPAMRMFGVPEMEAITARRPPVAPADRPAGGAMVEYDLTPGDYLVEIIAAAPQERISVCWIISAPARSCGE